MPGRRPNSKAEQGYILLTLIFFVAVLAISLATILPSVIQEARRDREEELVHRGAQYERAIRLYFKKNGRYPAKIEDLENTNEIRYLRKRYKDPMAPRDENGQQPDFKILHFGDPGVRLQQPGQPAQAQTGPNGAAAGAPGNPAQPAGGGISEVSPPQDADQPGSSTDAATTGTGKPAATGDRASGTASDAAAGKDAAGDQSSGDHGTVAGNQTFGGGAMVGVVSSNRKDNTIREFNKKHHYYEWQFLYDPTTDRGGIPTGPWQPQTLLGQPGAQQPVGQQIGQPIGNQPGANPAPNASPQPIGDPQQ